MQIQKSKKDFLRIFLFIFKLNINFIFKIYLEL
jgi:hypothetical protein